MGTLYIFNFKYYANNKLLLLMPSDKTHQLSIHNFNYANEFEGVCIQYFKFL